ncbi:hypothetical protein WL43_04000 [Burkholderia ubonensis]|nr:hypothetical protein WL43_04000 [Burkholderia ubonensis]
MPVDARHGALLRSVAVFGSAAVDHRVRFGRQRQIPAQQHPFERPVRQRGVAPGVAAQQRRARLLQIDERDFRVVREQQVQRLLGYFCPSPEN